MDVFFKFVCNHHNISYSPKTTLLSKVVLHINYLSIVSSKFYFLYGFR